MAIDETEKQCNNALLSKGTTLETFKKYNPYINAGTCLEFFDGLSEGDRRQFCFRKKQPGIPPSPGLTAPQRPSPSPTKGKCQPPDGELIVGEIDESCTCYVNFHEATWYQYKGAYLLFLAFRASRTGPSTWSYTC